MNRRSAMKWMLAGSVLAAAGLPGCRPDTTMTAVGQWVVSVATGVGKWISRTAQTFEAALAAAWNALFAGTVNGVYPDPNNPLEGRYDGILSFKVQWNSQPKADAKPNELSMTLDHPKMVRASATTSSWELAPEEKKRLNELRDQLTRLI